MFKNADEIIKRTLAKEQFIEAHRHEIELEFKGLDAIRKNIHSYISLMAVEDKESIEYREKQSTNILNRARKNIEKSRAIRDAWFKEEVVRIYGS